MANLAYQRTGDLQKAVQQIITNLAATTGAGSIGTSDGLGVQTDINNAQTAIATLQAFAAIPAVSVTTATGSFSTVEKYVSPAGFSISGGMTLGQAVRITIIGTCTSSAGNTNTIKIKYGANGTTADATITTLTFTASASGTTIPFKLTIDVVCSLVGASGTCFCAIAIANSGAATGFVANVATFNTAVSSAFANNLPGILGVSMVSSAGTTSYNVLAAYSEVVR